MKYIGHGLFTVNTDILRYDFQRDEFGPGLRRCGDPGLVFAVERLGLCGGVLVLLGPQDPAAHSHRSASQRTAG